MFKTFPINLKCLLEFEFHCRLSFVLNIPFRTLGLQLCDITKSGAAFYLSPVKMLLLTYICSIKLALSCFSGRIDRFVLLQPHILGECPFDHWHIFVRSCELVVESVVME